MKILPSARKHGIPDADIHHAIRNYVNALPDPDFDDQVMLIGPARSGALLEVLLVRDDDPRIIHAMPARPKYLR